MPPFRRAGFTQIILTLASLEPLGLLDTAYIEDDAGVDGQVTLRGPGGLVREVLVTGVDAVHEQFRAFIPLAGLPDGSFIVNGRARDVVGNETTFSLPFEVESGLGVVVILPGRTLLTGAYSGGQPLPARPALSSPVRAVTLARALGARPSLSAPLRRLEAPWLTP